MGFPWKCLFTFGDRYQGFWKGTFGKRGMEGATAGYSGFAESWLPSAGCMHWGSTGGREGASDPTVGQESSSSLGQTGRRLPAEVMIGLTEDREKQVLGFTSSAMFVQALVVDVFSSFSPIFLGCSM